MKGNAEGGLAGDGGRQTESMSRTWLRNAATAERAAAKSSSTFGSPNFSAETVSRDGNGDRGDLNSERSGDHAAEKSVDPV
jgi:hypothetical protein